jgi:SAM-dependent methyltransferase
VAAYWDLLRGDTSRWPDRAFYRGLIERSGEPVLDVGCGTGRLLLDYLAAGIDVDGVDVSGEMLGLCRAKAARLGLRPRLYEQAMEGLDLPRRYRTIIVPSSSFQLVTAPAAAAEAMRRFLAHLEPGGLLVMPFMELGSGEAEVTEAVRPEDGALVRRTSWARYDPATQLQDTEDRYEVLADGTVVASERNRRSRATRVYTLPQARELFAAAGFLVERVVSGFSERPYAAGDRIFTVLASAAPAA